MSEIEYGNKSYDSVDKMFEDMDSNFKNNHPIQYWFDEHFDWIKLGYAPHYSVTHPFVLLEDLFRNIKYAYQRVRFGYDERVHWSINYWLNPIMIKELNVLKNKKQGIPAKFFKSQEATENEDFEEAQKLWFDELDKMILGFESAQKLSDLDYDWKNTDVEKELLNNFDVGMNSFKQNYFSLWD